MVRVGEALQSLANVLATQQGNVYLALATILLIAAPVADRYLVRRKRIHFRVLYNSKIGLSPVALHDGETAPADPKLVQLTKLVDRMSIVIIRISNTGSFDIANDDFEIPISFTFGRRIVWDARISEATTDDLRQLIRENMSFFSTENSPPAQADARESLGTVRDWLGRRLSTWLGATQPSRVEIGPDWHGVRLTKLSLKRKEKFKLVVVLREPDDARNGEISKSIERRGRVSGGRIKDEKQQPRITWPAVATSIGVLLAGALITTLLTATYRPADASAQCAEGALRVEGSSAFIPTISDIAHEYTSSCGSAEITTDETGSVEGVAELSKIEPRQREQYAVVSDGRARDPKPELAPQPLAIMVFGMVANRSAGVRQLSLDQLKGIYEGRIRDWQQLRGGASLPITIVGRGRESGTRRIFEDRVLGGDEGRLSSNDCQQPNGTAASTMRCERKTTAEVIDMVNNTPGAIGYANASAATATAAQQDTLAVVELDGMYPEVNSIYRGYRFWATEYLYTHGLPRDGSLLKNFTDYLQNGTRARAELRNAGYTPCVKENHVVHELCDGR